MGPSPPKLSCLSPSPGTLRNNLHDCGKCLLRIQGPGEPLWGFVCYLSFYMILNSSFLMSREYILRKYNVGDGILVSLDCALTLLHGFVVLGVYHFHRGMPYKAIGPHGRAAVDVISLCSALIVDDFLPFLLLGALTFYLHSLGQLLHRMLDLDLRDALLGLLMQILVYTTYSCSYGALPALICCLGVISYRYAFYSAPINPDDVKKELASLPC